jgi:hypothetical protein
VSTSMPIMKELSGYVREPLLEGADFAPYRVGVAWCLYFDTIGRSAK